LSIDAGLSQTEIRVPVYDQVGGIMSRARLCQGWLLGLALCTSAVSGCVERRYIVYSDPPGAIVQENGRTVGAAPADRPFTYYGKYRFTLIRDGYQTLVVDEPIHTPWYEYFPLDFVVENLWPWTIRDVRTFTYKMEPLPIVPPETVLERAGQLRNRGQDIGALPGSLAGPELPAQMIPKDQTP
jgi:hypothetical protein